MTDDPFDLHETVTRLEQHIVAEADAILGAAWQALTEASDSGEGLLEEGELFDCTEEGVLYLCADDGFLPARAAKLLLTQYVDEDAWAADASLSDRLSDAFDGYLARLATRLSHHYGQQPMTHADSSPGPVRETDRDNSLTWTFGERRLSLQRGMRCGDGDFHCDLWLGVSAE